MGNWDQIEDGHKKQMVTSHIDGRTPCHGALITFSFHAVQSDEIRVYLWLGGKCMRFIPSDLLDVLPLFFDLNHESNRLFTKENSEIKTVMNNLSGRICRDKEFEKYFPRLSIQKNPEMNLNKYPLKKEEKKRFETTGRLSTITPQ